MKTEEKYIVVAVLILAVCSAGVVANNYWYWTTPCEALDISLTDARVIDFLDSTNRATADVYNCKNYQGYNTWLVNWHTQTQSQRVYVDIYTGEIIGTGPEPGPCWHTVTTFRGRNYKETAAFAIKGDMWRMNWNTVGHGNDSAISVYVHEQWNFIPVIDSFARDTFPFNSGTYCVYEGPETYFLDVRAFELEEWQIEIQDFY